MNPVTLKPSLIVIAPPGGSDPVVHVTGPSAPAVVHDAPDGADALTLVSYGYFPRRAR
jgi:hypothetical protein